MYVYVSVGVLRGYMWVSVWGCMWGCCRCVEGVVPVDAVDQEGRPPIVPPRWPLLSTDSMEVIQRE